MKPTIRLIPLSTPLTVTEAAMRAVRTADKLFLLSEKHPSAKPVLDAGLAYTSMDDLYDSAEDFDALQQAVAARLLEAGSCTLALTGAQDALVETLCESARGKADVEVLPGVPIGLAAFPRAVNGRRLCANALPERMDPSEPLLVEELDSRLLAGELKLRLTEYYPDDWQVTLASMRADGTFAYRELPLCMIDRQKRYGAACVLSVPAVPFDRLTRYGLTELIGVLQRLRAPGGCPWDREQTHRSLKESLLEECYEAMDAIEREDGADMVEELGDVLMQIALHAVIAQEQGRFTDRDITTTLVEKLVYRHPHVFGSVKVDSSEQVLANWAALKKTEKHQQTQTDTLRSVPKNFPALLRSRKVQKRAADVGFDWESAEAAFFKIGEETEELHRAMADGSNVEEEIGDLLFAVVNVARHLHLEPEFVLAAATEKFIDRFDRMEQLALSQGQQLKDLRLPEQDALWEAAKRGERPDPRT